LDAEDTAALALEIATQDVPQATRAIRQLLSLEVGSSDPDQGLLALDLTPVTDGVAVRLAGLGPVTVTREDALEAIREGNCVLGVAFGRMLGDMGVDWIVSSARLRRQREAIRSAQPRISVLPTEFVEPPSFERLRRTSGLHSISAIVGPSSSGKTVLLSAISREELHLGREVFWLDLTDPDVGVLGFVLELASRRAEGEVGPCVIMDDLQSAPVLAHHFLDIRRRLDVDGRWILGSWPDAVELIEHYLAPDQLVRTDPGDVCRRIVAQTVRNSEDGQRLLGLARGDALVAELGRSYYDHHRRVPSGQDLAEGAYGATVGSAKLLHYDLQVLRSVACLGMFEIDADVRLFTAKEQTVIDRLVQARTLRRNGDFVIFGHRTVARLVVRYLDRESNSGATRTAVQVAVEYLRRAGANQIKQTLDRLDLFSVTGSNDQFGAAFLAQCWTSLRVLVRHLVHQVGKDATWGDNTASAVFAANAFAELGMRDEWSAVSSYVRERWVLPVDADLPVPNASYTAELDDFREIQQRMIQEDSLDDDALGQAVRRIGGKDVDIDRFHRTWVLGLLLGFEGRALNSDDMRLAALRRMAANSLSPEGAFYPSRVPWVTARVLIGLALAGDTAETSDVAGAASSWLRTRPPIGPCRFGVWRSGTGSWNTDLQVTALVLLALGRAGVDPGDGAVRGGLNYLRAGRTEWYRPGKEIDAAQAVEAALVLGGHWRDYEPELRALLNWAQDSRSWEHTRAMASVTKDESSKVPAVVGALISVIWETVRAELPLLLQGVVGDSSVVGGASREAWLVLLERRLDKIDDAIVQNVRDRELLVSRGRASAETLAALEEWRGWADANAENKIRLRSLQVEFDAHAAELLREHINELGSALLGPAWIGMEVDKCDDSL
jgi:hypothetical protein